MDFNPGDAVFFIYKNERRYLRIHKIVMTVDGLMAQFEPGCACKAIVKPITQIYRTAEEFLAAIERGEA